MKDEGELNDNIRNSMVVYDCLRITAVDAQCV